MNKIFSELKHHCCIAVNKNSMYFYSSNYIVFSILCQRINCPLISRREEGPPWVPVLQEEVGSDRIRNKKQVFSNLRCILASVINVGYKAVVHYFIVLRHTI